MALKYRDAVVYVFKKSPDFKVTRVIAIVLSSVMRVPTTADRKPVKGALPVEHLELAVPIDHGAGPLKIRNMDYIFQPAYDVAPWAEDKHNGWEPLTYAKSIVDKAVEGYQARIAELEAAAEDKKGKK